jgi:hypothetical protein
MPQDGAGKQQGDPKEKDINDAIKEQISYARKTQND